MCSFLDSFDAKLAGSMDEKSMAAGNDSVLISHIQNFSK